MKAGGAMSATEELRRMLDERGVKWTSGDTKVSRNKYTHFCPDAGMSMGVWESGDGKLGIDAHTDYRFTPEQVIAATLGGGTIEKAAERIEVLSGLAREYLHRYGMLMSMAGEDVTDEVLAMESVINEVCGKKAVDE